MKILFACLLIFLQASALNSESLPSGWRYPDNSDMKRTWAQHKKKLPEPYHIVADFNEDGVPDHVWILMRVNQRGWGLFAFISSKTGNTKIIQIKEDLSEHPQERGLLYIKPGSSQNTACGLGIPKCSPGDAYWLLVETPTFQFFGYNGKSSYFHWDSDDNSFHEESIQD
jgi:hypothetical protein